MIDSNFNNGCVLIVGGSGGIGSLCAQEFANSGANVAITYYKNEQAAIDIANEINADVKIYQLDNSDPKSVEDTFKKVIKEHGSIEKILEEIAEEVKEIKEKFSLISKSLECDFGIQKPKIAVLSIDPHVGDGGIIGNDDDEILKPVLKEISEKGNLVFGPFSSDSFFGSGLYKKYDAVLAIYHDQGLIPFKTLSFGEGVNYTAGLNKIRTSPDHGTGYDIAGKGIADNTSFKRAIFSAIEILNSRRLYDRLNKNPLPIKKIKTINK